MQYANISLKKLLYCKKLGFLQRGTLPEHVTYQLVEQRSQTFEKNDFTLGVSLDLSKAFDTFDHYVLLKD